MTRDRRPIGRIRIGLLLMTAACGTGPADPVGSACPPTGGLTVTASTRIATTCTIAGDLVVLGYVTVADRAVLRIRGGTFIIVNDRHGRKERIKCFPSDTVLVLKKLISAKLGTRLEKIRLQRGNSVLSDLVTLDDYEINSGSSLEIYYN